MDIIDLSSDVRPIRSLPRAGPSSKAKAHAHPHKRKAPDPLDNDVIEITDSEEDEAGPSIRRSRALNISTSSSIMEIDADSFHMSQNQSFRDIGLPQPVAGPSNNPQRAAPLPPPSATPSLVLHAAPSVDMLLPPPPEVELEPEPEPDLISRYVAQVLEIVPDADPDHILGLITLHHEQYNDKVVEPVLHALFENPDYPKVDKKGKRKRDASVEKDKVQESSSISRRRVSEVEIDYADVRRPYPVGAWYQELAIARLGQDFPRMPVAHIKREFKRNFSLYAPTYIALDAEIASGNLLHKPLMNNRTEAINKGKGVQREDVDFDMELAFIQRRRARADAELAERLVEEEKEEAEEGSGIECGCCFTENPFADMIQCPDAHLFCKACMTSYASTKLGEHDANILCMDQSDCKLPFPESELQRLLTPKLLTLYERIKQRKEIEAAGLENLEECPFCEYKVVIENDQEKLFRCENADCGAVSCRACKKPDHLPKSCQEVQDDKKLDARHHVEEAMTAALMRNCPQCGKAFLKESGCNKMTCPNCRTMSCYVCRKVIAGYEHFNQMPPYNTPVDNKKCPLWDQVEQRHVDEVTAARKKAIEEYKRLHPEVDEKDIQIDLPNAPPVAPGAPVPGMPAVAPVHPHHPQVFHHPVVPAVPVGARPVLPLPARAAVPHMPGYGPPMAPVAPLPMAQELHGLIRANAQLQVAVNHLQGRLAQPVPALPLARPRARPRARARR